MEKSFRTCISSLGKRHTGRSRALTPHRFLYAREKSFGRVFPGLGRFIANEGREDRRA